MLSREIEHLNFPSRESTLLHVTNPSQPRPQGFSLPTHFLREIPGDEVGILVSIINRWVTKILSFGMAISKIIAY